MTDQQQMPFEPSKPQKKRLTLGSSVRSNFLAGLFVVAPAVVTFLILRFVVISLNNAIIGIIPKTYDLNGYLLRDIPGIGLVAGFLMLVTIGVLARHYVGRRLLGWIEAILYTIPGVRSVYGAIKQITDTLQNSNSRAFRDVVLLEYPRKGIWCLAFVTGTSKGEVQHKTDQNVVNIFLPTTPNPTSGFLLMVPKEDLIYLDMSVDEGMKMVISGGIVTPPYPNKKSALAKVEEHSTALVSNPEETAKPNSKPSK